MKKNSEDEYTLEEGEAIWITAGEYSIRISLINGMPSSRLFNKGEEDCGEILGYF